MASGKRQTISGPAEKRPRGRAVTHPVKYPDLGRRVEKRRLELGYGTQAEAAQAAGVSVATWGLLETGKSIPATARVRRKVSDALKWPPDVFDAAAEDIELGRPSGADDLRREVSELRFRVQDLERRLDALRTLPSTQTARGASDHSWKGCVGSISCTTMIRPSGSR